MESTREEVYEVLTYLLSELDGKCPFQFDQNIEVSKHLGRFYFNRTYAHLTKEDIYLEIDYEMQCIMLVLNIGKFSVTVSMFKTEKYPGLKYPRFGKEYADYLVKYFLEMCNAEDVKVGFWKRWYKEKNINIKEFIYGDRIVLPEEKEKIGVYNNFIK